MDYKLTLEEMERVDKKYAEDIEIFGAQVLASIIRRERQKQEIFRYDVQRLNEICHNDIRDHVAKQINRLFNFKLIQTEAKLINSRIDILAIDQNNNYVGIEIKKSAKFNEHKQFHRYYEELQ